jgi:hypothetical protein
MTTANGSNEISMPCNHARTYAPELLAHDDFSHGLTNRNLCVAVPGAAEKELASFYAAANDLFGPTAADKAAEVWLHVFEVAELDLNCLNRCLRTVTTQAAGEFIKSTWPVSEVLCPLES